MTDELLVLSEAGALTYARYVTSKLYMKAKTRDAKARITQITQQYQRELRQAKKRMT